VDNLNKLIAGTEQEKLSLDELVKQAQGPVFNNAAQHWNHSFYWNSLTPKSGPVPAKLEAALVETFGSVAKFKEEFSAKALGTFGSGWAWLVKNKDGKLSLESTSNAGVPITAGLTPLLTLDVWEHAYYIDYRNARAKYIEAFWNVVNWDFAAKGF